MPALLMSLLATALLSAPPDRDAVGRLVALAGATIGADTAANRRALAQAADEAGVPWLRAAALSTDLEDRVRAWERLLSWQAELSDPTAPPADLVRREAAAVLADPAYRPLAGRSWIEPWIPYVERLFDLLFAPLLGRDASSSWQRLGLGLLYAACLAAVTWVLARALRRPPRPARASPAAAAAVERQPEEWLRQADVAAGDGAFHVALNHLYIGLLLRLDQLERLRFDPSRTHWEQARAARSPGLQTALGELAEVLDAVAYGGARAGRAEYDRCLAVARRAWSER